MKKPSEDQEPVEDPEEAAVEEFMKGSTRAGRLLELCDALRLRIRGLREEIQRTPPGPDYDSLEDRIQDARHQLAVLKQELAISEFVEDSVRVSLRGQSGDREYDDEMEWP